MNTQIARYFLMISLVFAYGSMVSMPKTNWLQALIKEREVVLKEEQSRLQDIKFNSASIFKDSADWFEKSPREIYLGTQKVLFFDKKIQRKFANLSKRHDLSEIDDFVDLRAKIMGPVYLWISHNTNTFRIFQNSAEVEEVIQDVKSELQDVEDIVRYEEGEFARYVAEYK